MGLSALVAEKKLFQRGFVLLYQAILSQFLFAKAIVSYICLRLSDVLLNAYYEAIAAKTNDVSGWCIVFPFVVDIFY